jgi:N-acetylglucosaminyl-diphospho-decaprenol L-rhamnosyltransferase
VKEVDHGCASEEIPTLSIVIVNSNGTNDTLRCLDSILRSPPRDSFEIILVDNCSSTPIQPLIAERFPRVRTYEALAPQGFARNYNFGIRQAFGSYVMILNNDTTVHPQALDLLVDALKQHPKHGMAGPCLISPVGKVQSSCARAFYTPLSYSLVLLLFDLGLPPGRLREAFLSRRVAMRQSGPVPCIDGACMVVSRSLLDEIGPLDEGYDFYFEDMEWCHRAQKAGWPVVHVAEAKVTHYGDQSLSKVKEWAKQSEFRSALRYFRQYHNLSNWQARLLWLVTAVSFLLRILVFAVTGMVSRRPDHARVYWNLFKWVLRQEPRTIK